MRKSDKIELSHLFLMPGLLSLGRIILTPFIGYFLSLGTGQGILVCLALLALAGLTDFLDGFLARRLNQITPLGIILDPLADKIFTITIIVELILFCAFPVWLAIAIIAREIIIILGALLLIGRKTITPSNLTGKYYFGSIFCLLLSYIINFPFGETIFLYITIFLLVGSLYNYGRIFFIINCGGEYPVYQDRPIYKYLRICLMVLVILIYLYKLYGEVLANYLH
jgi:CDP-diacylglycerol--glycerol-3-phosphate 3-phosphatidyltransferase